MNIVIKILVLLFILSILTILFMLKLNSCENLVCIEILFSKYKKNCPILLKTRLLLIIFYTIMFIISEILSIIIYNTNKDAENNLKNFVATTFFILFCFISIIFYLKEHFIFDINNIKFLKKLKKQQKYIKENYKNIYKELDKNTNKIITIDSPLNLYETFLGHIVVYKQLTKNKNKIILGSIIVSPKIIFDTLEDLPEFSYSTVSEIIISNFINNLNVEDRRFYLPFLRNILKKDNIVSKTQNFIIYEDIKIFDIEQKIVLNDDSAELDNSEILNILRGLESNQNEDIHKVYELLSDFLLNPNCELGDEDINEIIEIYITDELLKKEFLYVLNNYKSVYRQKLKNLRIYK